MKRTCAKCGNSDEDMKFCTKCGEPYPVERKEEDEDDFFEEERQEEKEEEDMSGLRKTKLTDKWRIINTSATLIVGAQGKRDTVTDGIKKILDSLAAPNLRVEFRKVRLAGITSWFAGSRKQLVVENRKMRGYHVFVSIIDYGNQLSVSWYLILRENWLTKMLKMASANVWAQLFLAPFIFTAKIFYAKSGYTIPELMNMFDIEELTAYTTTVQYAVKEAVNALVKENNLNPAKVTTHTRGFLNLS